jgi:hypothetical protein
MRRILNRLVPRPAWEQLDDPGRRLGGSRLRIGRRRAVRALPVALVAIAILPLSAFAATWRTEAAVKPAGLTNATLGGVSCLSATSCLAVGNGNAGQPNQLAINPSSFGEIWNGTAWTVAPIVSARGTRPSLTSVCRALPQSSAWPLDRLRADNMASSTALPPARVSPWPRYGTE